MSDYQLRPELTDEQKTLLVTYEPLIQKLLYYRGITDEALAKKYFSFDYEKDLHDPFLLPDMQPAVDRILHAVKNEEHITIYADYDADGIPGSVVLYDFFRMINYEHISVYIPHRNKEGFGLNMSALETIADGPTRLLITIDCGTADVDEVAYAKELGLDVIITDHHKENEKLPDALIVNHKISTATYPEQVLCGSGVVFKLVQALVQQDYFAITKGKEKWLLDMVGIATLSDMVPLVGENRILAHYGMLVLRKSPRKGLLHLLKKAGTKQETISETDIGFTISPRINAASRMGKPMDAFDLLTALDDVTASNAVAKLEALNNERKGHVASIVKKAKKKLGESKQDTSHVVVVGDPTWQPSLLGLVANALAEQYQCPTFVWGKGDGKEIKGSCRTGNSLGVHGLLQDAKDVFITAGGHDEAGGFVVKLDSVDLLHDALHEAAKAKAMKQDTKVIHVDASISLGEAQSVFQTSRSLAPFGVGNEEPLFQIENVLFEDVVMFGKQQNHVKCICKNEAGISLEAMAFFKTEDGFTKKLENGMKGTIIGILEQNQWGYKKNIRIRIHEIL